MTRALPSLGLASRDTFEGTHIPFSRVVAPGVVTTRAGDLLASWSFGGLPFEGLSDGELEHRMDSFNLLVQSFSNGRFAFWTHRIRGATADRLESPSEGFAKRLMDKYYDEMMSGGLVATKLFLTLVYRQNPQSGGRALGKIGRSPEEVLALRRSALDALENACDQLQTTLQDYKPTRLSDYQIDGVRFSKQLELFDFLINGRWGLVAVKDVPLYQYLPVTRKIFGNELFEIRGPGKARYGSFLDLQDYADFTNPGTLNSLLRLGSDYVETHSFSPMARLDAASALKRRIRQLSNAEDDSPSQRAGMQQALDDLSSGKFALGSYHYSLLIYGDDEYEVKARRSDAVDLLQKAGFRAAVVDVVPDAAFWAQLPSNHSFRPRLAEIGSRNFTGLSSMHNFDAGKRDGNPWGEALAIFRSPSGQPFYFNCHATPRDADSFGEKALGATQIIGQSGEGKTVLAGFIAASLTKYGADWVWFDKDRSAEILIRAMGGRYLTLERGVQTGFAPFKREPNEREVMHWVDLVKMCAKPPSREYTTREEAEIDHAVRAVALLPTHQRGFEAVLQNLPVSKEDEIHARLSRWSKHRKGVFGWALDGDADLVSIGGGVPHGFDYTELLEDESVHPQVMMNLIYRTEEVIDGRRFAFVMEEYWKALSNAYFQDFAKNKQKTIRKQNGFGIYMTQSPSDTLANPIAKTLIEQTATFIFLANPTADYKDYVEGFKLTEAEYRIVRTLPRRSQLMLIKQGSSVSIGSLNLRGFKDELMVLSGSTEGVTRLDGLRKRLGDAPENWMDAFLKGEK